MLDDSIQKFLLGYGRAAGEAALLFLTVQWDAYSKQTGPEQYSQYTPLHS